MRPGFFLPFFRSRPAAFSRTGKQGTPSRPQGLLPSPQLSVSRPAGHPFSPIFGELFYWEKKTEI